jgi:HAD superfamily hydrolase (TIGR01549 family)
MKITPIKAIVWDLDGTLIKFKIDFIRARRKAIKILKKYGVPKNLLTVKGSILENVSKSRDYFHSNKTYESEKITQIINEVDEEINEVEYEAALQASHIDGIDEVLEYIKSINLKQAIFTFNTHRNAEVSLQKVNLMKYFELIVGRDNVEKMKPHPDHLLSICEKFNVLPSEIIVIGDSSRDIEAALNVGAKSIAIKNNLFDLSKGETFQKADKIIEENDIPLKLIKSLKELLNI